MIFGILHKGSGLGDQLFRYLTVRSLAEDRSVSWGMVNPENFKGSSFMQVNLGTNLVRAYVRKIWNEKDIREGELDVRSYDPEINFIPDNTVVDGNFEDFRYWGHNLSKFSSWLNIEPLNVPKDVCIIGFRGGEYATQPDLFLPKEYWDKGIARMRSLGIDKFEVHTDDPALAAKIFPDFPIVDNKPISHSLHTNMGFNWRTLRYAKYAIISNSAFYIIPRLMAHNDNYESVTLAPRFWARHNTGVWARPSCYYPQFTYYHAGDID